MCHMLRMLHSAIQDNCISTTQTIYEYQNVSVEARYL